MFLCYCGPKSASVAPRPKNVIGHKFALAIFKVPNELEVLLYEKFIYLPPLLILTSCIQTFVYINWHLTVHEEANHFSYSLLVIKINHLLCLFRTNVKILHIEFIIYKKDTVVVQSPC